jgi:hypothetical protein
VGTDHVRIQLPSKGDGFPARTGREEAAVAASSERLGYLDVVEEQGPGPLAIYPGDRARVPGSRASSGVACGHHHRVRCTAGTWLWTTRGDGLSPPCVSLPAGRSA